MRLGGQLPDGWIKTIPPGERQSIPEMKSVRLDVHLGGKLSNPQIGISAQASSLVLPGSAPNLKDLELAAVLKGTKLAVTQLSGQTYGGTARLTGELDTWRRDEH